MKPLTAVPYEKDNRNLPKMSESKNSQNQGWTQESVSVSRVREQKIASVQATDKKVVENQTKSKSSSESGIKRSRDERTNPEAQSVPTMRENNSSNPSARSSLGLQKETGSGVAMSAVPPRGTFDCRDLVLAEPHPSVPAMADKDDAGGEARESTRVVASENLTGDSRGGSQTLLGKECPNCGRLYDDCMGNCIFNE